MLPSRLLLFQVLRARCRLGDLPEAYHILPHGSFGTSGTTLVLHSEGNMTSTVSSALMDRRV